MTWSYERAQRRIEDSLASAPQVRVENFSDYLPRMIALRASRMEDAPEPNVIRDLGPGAAVIVDTVQVYVNVVNYNEMRLEAGRETEVSHGRALSFLHVHYAALDRASDGVGGQRVDFHGPRMHTVFIHSNPEDLDGYREAVRRALRLARETVELSAAGSRDIVRSQIAPKFRIGIDIGRCVAIDSGKKGEREPLFIGSAANHAAKLAEGSVEGIFVSDRVRSLFGIPQEGSFAREHVGAISPLQLSLLIQDGFSEDEERVARKIGAMRDELRKHRDATIGTDGFVFHYHEPPLRSIDYAALRPSNSIRMPLVSIFADLDGYTAYVDNAVRKGGVALAVRDLHVIRTELNAVLQDDFQGRRVRFIGDCLHGLIAAGNAEQANLTQTVERATACVGALRSSFDLCLDSLTSAASLGLAIGYELGSTPISRIGIRGERSVRVASSVATLTSELCQRACGGSQSKIGAEAFKYASPATRRLFDDYGVGSDIDFDTVALQSPAAVAAGGETAEPVAEARHHCCA
jgi:class 3 adenylate cyclase